MGNGKRKIAEKKEILRFYTSIMRGEDEHASVSNRLSAAEKLISQIESEAAGKSSEEKLDRLLREMKGAAADGRLTAKENDPDAADEIEPALMDTAEDEDEEQQ